MPALPALRCLIPICRSVEAVGSRNAAANNRSDTTDITPVFADIGATSVDTGAMLTHIALMFGDIAPMLINIGAMSPTLF
jgi:hypothetical protein